ncbi:CubicO group peptidase (beta-lactamase class C family) [Povalibacter uvarum]|uniref:CubicO group peptidase (Beta-lactamase class C family) n=1 Tax=Povalibacter uvarum TaxID=732238 RepID=A0A841HFV0_9GAMM|nr:serine hydrolase domain-containing protein [Povalibacter uvarum]MBB6091757.1 CubicO group peptidase (beta-lactamase class C family) [Povalibacter uvarum]
MQIRPEAAGFVPSRLQHLDRFLQSRYLETGRLPCALTLIQRRGEIAHLSALGQRDIERQQKVTEDTLFRIYSMTKPITSVAFMMLVEDGLVALDEPVHKYIPQWRDLGVYDGGFIGTFKTHRPQRPMLIVDLLRHTSGLTYGFQQRTNVDAAYRRLRLDDYTSGAVTLDGMIDTLATLPLEFSPGTVWNYSVATDVLGYLVGKISGQPFEQFLRSRILDPLGMKDTDFSVPPDKQSRLAACYAATPEGGMRLQDDPQRSPFLKTPHFVSGGGGLISTLGDYLRFCRMLIGGGTLDGVRILSPKTLELMTSNHLPDGKELPDLSVSLFSETAYAGVGFGLGFSVTLNPARSLLPGSIGDYSWGGMASTYFWVDPHEDMIVIFMTQLMPSTTYPLRRELRTAVYSAFA